LTPRERKFARGLAEGKSQKQASIEAAPPGSVSDNSLEQWASRKVRDSKFQKSFKEILAENGLADEDVARAHRENLQATKVVATASQDGQITDVIERPDYATRQRAVSDAWRINDRMKPGSAAEQPVQQRIIVLSQKDADMFRVFTGDGSLPKGFQIAPEGVAAEVLGEDAGTVDVRAEEVSPHETGG